MAGIRIDLIATTILVILAVLAPVAAAEVSNLELNTDERTWIVNGYIEFTVAQGSTSIGGVEIGPGDVVTVLLNDVNSGYDYAKIWVSIYGWVDVEAESDKVVLLVNGVEVANGEWRLNGIKADLATFESTLTIHVPSDDPGWTHLVIEGETLIRGVSEDEIVVVNAAPSDTVALNFNLEDQFLRSGADTVEVNGQEVCCPRRAWRS